MRTQTLLLVFVLVLLVTQFYFKFIVDQHTFIHTSCLSGTVKLDGEDKMVYDCIGCYTFDFPIKQEYGGIIIDNKSRDPPQSNQPLNQQQSSLLVGIWYSKDCQQYQCQTFIQQQSSYFFESLNMKELGFQLSKENRYKMILNDSKSWKVEFPYSNNVANIPNSLMDQIYQRVFSPIMGEFRQAKNYYSSLAIRFRYSPSHIQEQNYKPQIKMYHQNQSPYIYILLSLIVASTILHKISDTFLSNLHLSDMALLLGFLSPYLISLLSIVVMSSRKPGSIGYLIGLPLYISYMMTGHGIYVIIAVVIMLGFFYRQNENHQPSIIQPIAMVVLLLISNYLLEMKSMMIMCPNILYALISGSQHNIQEFEQIESGTNKEMQKFTEEHELQFH